jgi:hypothetical protein
MPNVMCRLELHDATTREQYDQFHAEMETLGLVRTISRDGKEFRLPSGLYLGVNVTTFLELLKLRVDISAIRITAHPCKLALWIVDSPDNISISGLEDVTPSYGALAGLLGGATPSKGFPFMSLFGEYQNTSQK